MLVGLVVVWLIFHWTAETLGSYRGEYGLLLGAIVVSAAVIAEMLLFRRTPKEAARALGLGRGRSRGPAVAAAIGAGLLLVYPLFSLFAGARLVVADGWWRAVPGLFAQAGIAEEVLFRGYLFRHLRTGRSFWRAATLAVIPFAAVHVVTFGTLDFAVALGATILSVVLSFPLAHLFELGGHTIWAPALLHTVVQGGAKLVGVSDDRSVLLAVMWMAGSALLPLAAFAVPREASTDVP